MDLFHEMRDVMDETLNWEFLCLKLHELTDALLPKPVAKYTKSPNKKRRVPKAVFMPQKIPEGLEWLACRQYIPRRLEEVHEICIMGYRGVNSALKLKLRLWIKQISKIRKV